MAAELRALGDTADVSVNDVIQNHITRCIKRHVISSFIDWSMGRCDTNCTRKHKKVYCYFRVPIVMFFARGGRSHVWRTRVDQGVEHDASAKKCGTWRN